MKGDSWIISPGPSWRFWRSRIVGRWLYRRSFGAFGAGTVLVTPRRLKNVGRIRLGSQCVVYEGAWLQCELENSELVIGDHVYIGHDAHLHATGRLSIGDGCVLADRVTILDGDHDPSDFAQVASRGDIVVGKRVFIGTGATILGGVTLGDDCRVGAGTVVTRSFGPGTTVGGVPARAISVRSAQK